MSIVRVALDVPLPKLFDYLAEGAGRADIGRRVIVPFGQRRQVGLIVELAQASEVPAAQLKAVIAIDRDLPPMPAEWLKLARFAATYYQHPLGATLLSLLPPALKRLRPPRAEAPTAYVLTAAGLAHIPEINPRAKAQRQLAERLQQGPLPVSEAGPWRGQLRLWHRTGWVEAAETMPASPATPSAKPELTPDQAAALAAVRAAPAGFAAWLLHGVTGSGKTEVYLRLIEEALAAGRQALVLVPEIHLTPQTEAAFRNRFPSARQISLHSGLADGERLRVWRACLDGRVDLVLGTRLAVFTPLNRLGLIVVDEEHDASYKQQEGLRYSARDVAVWRARQLDIPIVLGSATPALETWRNAARGRYRRLELSARAHAEAVLPAVKLIDTRVDRPRLGLSASLIRALQDRLARGEQSLLFINRRGYAPTLYCNACGYVVPCPRCSAHQVLHRKGEKFELRCHHCGLLTRPPEVCPDCGSPDLRPAGQGTQRLEETLATQFPEARILRIDRDTASRRGAFAAMREAVNARAVDILVGTQIVTKGHDFPHLTLVGVLGADQALLSPDFRATERLFAQLMQVAGRAGRAGRPGEVLVQTGYPGHPLYRALQAHDFARFAAQMLKERREMEFPPFSHQALLRAEAERIDVALAFLDKAKQAGLALARQHGVSLFDPTPALLARVARRERAQLLVQAGSRGHLQDFLGPWLEAVRGLPARTLKWSIDVDPLDF
ncbi:replication restart DNA helicase PriA [Sulfuritortus calidifontis]|uniref:Replication restart protein PriA n=1 Tax=Sulfuritortus calidifontis TaxID=1914471 RepID=A0A4R3JT47_9PROT|nr:primosomal protein N' [Sulfuritortus calidifontis]TCS69447.1 replication restart DNA helicase PriA [Sulfuritortus calidifontis]